MPLANLDKSPFHDFLIPGLLLFFFLGVYPATAAYSLWRRPGWKWPNRLNPFQRTHWSWAGSLGAGAALVVWIVVQIQWVQVCFLHILFLGWGVLILGVTLLPSVRRHYALSPDV